MYESIHGMAPECLRSNVVFRDNVNSYCLRNSENKLALPQAQTDYLKIGFPYRGAEQLTQPRSQGHSSSRPRPLLAHRTTTSDTLKGYQDKIESPKF